jgi:hypothetical protein
MSRREWIGASELIAIPAIPHIVERVRALSGEFYLRAEVADALGISPSTLRRIAARIVPLGPSGTITAGTLTVPVYNTAAIARLHAHLAEQRSRRGRPRLWTDEERRARRAAHAAAGYRRRRAAELRDRADHDGADRMLRDADRIRADLRFAHRRRQHSLGSRSSVECDE